MKINNYLQAAQRVESEYKEAMTQLNVAKTLRDRILQEVVQQRNAKNEISIKITKESSQLDKIISQVQSIQKDLKKRQNVFYNVTDKQKQLLIDLNAEIDIKLDMIRYTENISDHLDEAKAMLAKEYKKYNDIKDKCKKERQVLDKLSKNLEKQRIDQTKVCKQQSERSIELNDYHRTLGDKLKKIERIKKLLQQRAKDLDFKIDGLWQGLND